MLLRRIESAPAFARFFNDVLDRELLENGACANQFNATTPAVNIIENKDSFTIEVAAPGLKKEDFNISVKDNTLTISSEKKEEKESEESKYTRKEYSYQSFSRTFTLSEKSVNTENISAKYENGELIISIPKKEEAKSKEPRLVEVF